MSNGDLIQRYIEPNPNRPGLDEARLRDYGVAIWAIIGYWRGYNGDVDRVAREYVVPREAVEAAVEYYRQHEAVIDARIQANDIAAVLSA
jgi:uncharacterized protein (DUF433 family)